MNGLRCNPTEGIRDAHRICFVYHPIVRSMPNGEPGVSEAGQSPVAFEAIQALPGFCRLYKRSPTLDGSLPLRAVQHCAPVFEGNEAGFQISLEQPMTMRRNRRGIHIDMTPPAFRQTQDEARGRIERLVEEGLIRRGGYWHRLFSQEALPIRGSRIHLWSGFLVRPAAGVCLRVGQAFNRRSRISVVEHVIVDASAFTPLVLEIDGKNLSSEPLWIEGEIGCVLPIAPAARMTLSPVRRAPKVVETFETFFSSHYFEMKKSRPTGKYRRMLRNQETEPAATTCNAEVLYAGPAVHALSSLTRFHGPAGVARRAPEGVALPRCTVRNTARIDAAWDGQSFTRDERGLARVLPALERDWRAAGGSLSSDGYEFLSGYLFTQNRDEPYFLVQPWVFSLTPPGWSTVVEGLTVAGSDGMRGIIQTDRFHPVSMVYRIFAPGPVVVPRGAPLMRFFPIPRRLQNATMRLLET
jgi:hypothetical protein